MQSQSNTSLAGLCLDCNYPLRGLSSGTCPECGRPFDAADPGTMNMGRPVGRVGRLLLRPIGWPTIALALLATAAMLYATRPPARMVAPSAVDVPYYLRAVANWRARNVLLTDTDYVYAAALCAWLLAASSWGFRTAARFGLARSRRWPRRQLVRQGRRQAVLAVLALVAAAALLFGWPYRIGNNAVAWEGLSLRVTGIGRPPLPTSPPQELAALHTAALRLPQRRQQVIALKLLVEQRTADALPVLVDAAARERDAEVAALELHLIGLYRDPDTAELLARFMKDDHRPAVRAAAADALGAIHLPWPHLNQSDWFMDVTSTASDPPIEVAALVDPIAWAPQPPQRPARPLKGPDEEIPLPDALRVALRDVMLNAATAAEREAAARALVGWPPPSGYALRVAEWGVWIDGGGELKLVQSVLDEIPPFVHRTGNPPSEFADRINPIQFVTKPVIHLSAGEAMAVDLEVQIRLGRPWFAYPKPDDFNLATSSVGVRYQRDASGRTVEKKAESVLRALDHPRVGPMPPGELAEGYPWLRPVHRRYGPTITSMAAGSQISALGLRWQSLIVSPQRQSWMTPPVVDDAARHGWWARLRDVPCSWVSSRGESERFVYYDGPTRAPSPVQVRLAADGNSLRLRPRNFPESWYPQAEKQARLLPADVPMKLSSPLAVQSRYDGPPFVGVPVLRPPPPKLKDRSQRETSQIRRALFVRVDGTTVAGRVVPVPRSDATVSLDGGAALSGLEQAEAALRRMVTDAGLTGPEADGLLDCWRPQFFEAAGSRFLLVLAPADYDALCPMSVRPEPTEVARVGIVLTEFEGSAGAPR